MLSLLCGDELDDFIENGLIEDDTELCGMVISTRFEPFCN